MTVSTTTNKVSYSGTGSQTVFAYTFKIFANGDLDVYIRDTNGTETLQTITTHYTVSGAGSDSGGNVTFITAPGSTDTVVIQRKLTLTQGTDYVANDPFPAESHEDALDRLTFITQQIQEEVDRSIKASVTNTITSTEFTISATDRANKVFSFDGSGDLAVTQELGTFKGSDATVTTAAYVERDIIKSTTAGQLNNIYICVAASVAGDSLTDTDHFALIVDAVAAATSASTATTKASEAAASATAAASSATSATSSASSATSSASTASTAATAAQTAQSAAETAETNAETAETNAETAETNAASSATAAASSATSAASSATTATTKASEASTSATNAAASATTATTKASEAATSATNASSSASTATTKASEASTSATNAASSATAAASSATASASSATSAANSAAAAAASYDQFDDRYLGSKTSDPSVDNDGNALVTGALYFNSSANEMRVYDGANWIAASSAGTASLILYEYTATSGQTTFSGSDDNSATLSYSVGNIQVVMNGVILDPSDFTATSGTSVVLASGAATGDLLNIYAFKSFTVSDTVSASAGGTFAGNVNVTGNLDVDGTTTLDGLTVDGDVTLNDGSPNLRLQDSDVSRYMDVAYGTRAASFTNTMASGEDMDTVQPWINFRFKDDGETRETMRIDRSGSTFFNCTSAPSASVVGSAFIKTDYDSQLQLSGSLTTGNNIVEFYNPNGRVGSIATNGSATAYNTSSDYRLKENVTYDWDATTRLKQLKPARFNFIANADTTVDGFLAHEAQAVVPEAVTGTHNEVDDDGNPVHQGIDQSKLVPLLVKTIQELEARITALEAE